MALEELSLEDVDLALTLANGVLEVKPLSAKVAGGELRGDLSFLSGRAAPTMTARLELKGAELDELLAESRQRDLVSGKIDVSADLKGSGTSMRELASSLDGRLSLVMGEGKIHNEYLDYIAADLLSALFSAGPREDETTVNCLVARFDVQDGVASVGDLLLDTHRITVAGRGAINLATETVSLTLAPRPKDPSLVSLAVPVDVRGPLASPHARPNPEGVALGVAGLAAGAVVGPLGLLIPMVSSGTGEENPCIAALERAGVAESATPPAEQRAPETAPSSPLDDLLEGIRGLFD